MIRKLFGARYACGEAEYPCGGCLNLFEKQSLSGASFSARPRATKSARDLANAARRYDFPFLRKRSLKQNTSGVHVCRYFLDDGWLPENWGDEKKAVNEWRRTWAEAFKRVEAVCNTIFKPAKDKASADLTPVFGFEEKPLGTLAYAYLPLGWRYRLPNGRFAESPKGVFFDRAERWAPLLETWSREEAGRNDISWASWTLNAWVDPLAVALHELCHFLGLPHHRNRRSALYPRFNFVNPVRDLAYWERGALAAIYGERRAA